MCNWTFFFGPIKVLLFLTFVGLMPFPGHSQDACVYLKDGTARTGPFKITATSQEVFRKDSISIRYAAAEIAEFRSKGQVYYPVTYQEAGQTHHLLAERLYTCGIELLSGQVQRAIQGIPTYSQEFFWWKNGEKIQLLNPKNLEQNYQVLFGQDFKKEMNQKYRYQAEDILKVLQQQGYCTRPSNVPYQQPNLLKYIGIRSFFGRQALRHLSDFADFFQLNLRDRSWSAGFGIKLYSKKQLNLEVLGIYQEHYVASAEVFPVFAGGNFPITYSMQSFLLEILLSHDIKYGNFSLQPGVGFFAGRYSNYQRDFRQQAIVANGLSLIDFLPDYDFYGALYGVRGQLELSYRIAGRAEVYAAANYQTNLTRTDVNNLPTEYGTKGFGWRLGLAFLIDVADD